MSRRDPQLSYDSFPGDLRTDRELAAQSPTGRPMSPHSAAFCDWAPIQDRPTRPCKGGCGTRVDAADGFCLECRGRA